ncbi:MAG: phosphatidate cytidylyltransferase [Candidatus Brocadiaceae bacterium]|nr:phosphatidate cytidylyltransferase [Candidatus Brocadiaceae bacterium]
MNSTLRTRIKLGITMFAAFFGVLLLDFLCNADVGFGCAAIFAGGMGLFEFYYITGKSGFSPFRITGIGVGMCLFVLYWFAVRKGTSLEPHFFRKEIVLAFIFLLLIIQSFTHGTKDAIKNISVTIFGVFYVPFLLSFAFALRYLPNGMCLLILVLLVSKFGDIGGYLFGRKFGKHKLARNISPNKTIEGACFAIISSVLIAVIFSLISQTRIMSLPWSVLFGVVIGFSALLGDLVESLLKRDAKVKDSSNLVPEFGGILDVIDCLLISMPVAYYFFIVFRFV